MTNIFRKLQSMLPPPAVLVGIVREIHDDDTSTVEIPGNLPLTGYGDGTTATGSLIRPRGTSVPVGKRAFVRAGVIETRAPDNEPIDIPLGSVVFTPPDAPEPVDFVLDTMTGTGDFSTRSGEVGATWTLHADTGGGAIEDFVLDGAGYAKHVPSDNSEFWVTPSGVPPSAEYSIEVIFRIPSAVNRGTDFFVKGRSAPGNLGYTVFVTPVASPSTDVDIFFQQRDGGGSTTLYSGTIALANGVDHTLLMELLNGSKRLVLNGTELVNSALNGATAAGEIIFMSRTTTSYAGAGIELSKFRAYTP